MGSVHGNPRFLAGTAAGLTAAVLSLWAMRGLPLGFAAFWLTPLPLFASGLGFGPAAMAWAAGLAAAIHLAVAGMLPMLSPGELEELQQLVQTIHAAEPLLNYLQDVIAATRSGRWFVQGLSPRAGIAVLRAARAQALLSGRDYVAPDDIQAILPQTVAHRLVPVGDAGRGAVEQVRAMLDAVPLP